VSLGVTAIGIGSGMSNTTTADNNCTLGAIQVAADYTNNNKIDWHLASKDELNELYKQKTYVGGFAGDLYWSSSEIDAGHAWYQYFSDGSQYGGNQIEYRLVRPVRAF
jgi:hypothetical protein